MTAPTPELDALIADGVARTGLPERKVRRALGTALGLLDKHAAEPKLRELYLAVPGTEALARAPEYRPRSGGGGLFGGIMRSAGGLSGAAMADAMAALKQAEREGVSRADLKTLMPIAIDYVRARTGKDLLREVVESVPGVGALLAER